MLKCDLYRYKLYLWAIFSTRLYYVFLFSLNIFTVPFITPVQINDNYDSVTYKSFEAHVLKVILI